MGCIIISCICFIQVKVHSDSSSFQVFFELVLNIFFSDWFSKFSHKKVTNYLKKNGKILKKEEPKISLRLGVNKSIWRLPYYFALLLTVFFVYRFWELFCKGSSLFSKKFISFESIQSGQDVMLLETTHLPIVWRTFLRFFLDYFNVFLITNEERPTSTFFHWLSFVCISEMFISVLSQLSVILM